MHPDHYDVIVIGSGPGGASLAQKLAATGKRILLLERGDYLPRSTANWDSKTVFVDGAYQAKETWYGADGSSFHPGLHYFVGGNSKVYGAALLRLRERDFDEIQHKDGISPAWPLKYDAFEPYYTEAERLFQVHGQRGEDPNEPPSSAPFPFPPVSHEPRVQELSDSMTVAGLRPFHLPLGILLDEREGRVTPTSTCIRCDAFDGFPCLLNGKADAQVICVDPALAAYPNLHLLTNAYVSKLTTDSSGRQVTGVHVTCDGEEQQYSADIVVVACGALSSALLLLRSASDAHPNGLANGSRQVGRNYMRHNQSVLMAVLREPNDTVFQKTLAISDYYFGADDWEFPLGLIQMCATSHADQIKAEALPGWLEWLPEMPFDVIARHSMDFWLSSEDLPRPENRVFYDGDHVMLHVTENNMEAHRRLRKKLEDIMGRAGAHPVLLERSLYFGKNIPISGTAHQAGTARFGTDPASTVLDLNCRTHELDNLYVVDASFFPSIGAVNPTLTIIANALRVADHLRERLGAWTAGLAITLTTRCLLVVLFLPFSALDKILNFRDAVAQAKQAVASEAAAIVLIMGGFAIEIFMSLGVVTGIADRLAALVLAGYCMVTALLWKQFWTAGDFWHAGDSQGRTLFWDFLKNFSLAGGFLLVTFGTTDATGTAFLAHPFASSHPYQLERP